MKKLRIYLKILFTILFWGSLLPYLFPWIWAFRGLIYGSGESIFDRFTVYGWDAFAHGFIWGTIALMLIVIPTLLYQIVFIICTRKDGIKVKIIVVAILLIIVPIVYLISHSHFSNLNIEQFRY
jgi:hypothetical protein